MKRAAVAGAAALSLGAVLFLVRAGARDPWEPDETRHLHMGREIGAAGSWLFPTLRGAPYPDYGPLFFWLIRGSGALFGPTDVRAGVYATAAGALAALLATLALGRALGGARAGLIAAVVLATTVNFAIEARNVELDVLLAATVPLALLGFWRWHQGDPRWFAVGVLGGALGWLTKGPVGFLLPGLAFTAWLAARRDGRGLLRFALWGGAAILGCGAAWYGLAAIVQGWEFAKNILVQETVARFFTREHHRRGPFYLAARFPLQLLPWTPFLIAAAFRLRRAEARRDAAFLLPLAGLAAVFLFFSLSRTKRTSYLLPVYPLAALAVGAWWDRLLAAGGRPISFFGKMLHARAQLVSCAGIAGALIVAYAVFVVPRMNEQRSFRPIAAEMRALGAGGARFATYGFDSEALRLYLPGIRGLRKPEGFRDFAAEGPVVVLVKAKNWGEIESAARRHRDVRLGRNEYVLGVAVGPGR